MQHINEIYIIIIGAIVAGFVQGLSGFAFGMVAMSFWAWIIEPKLAVVLVVFGAVTGQTIAAVRFRRSFKLKLLLPFVIGGFFGIPLGVKILPYLNINIFKLIFGLLLILWCPIMLFSNKLPHIKLKVGEQLINGFIGFMGGIMSGIGGFAGVIPTLWCVIRGYDKNDQRTVIQNFNLIILATTMVIYIKDGIVNTSMIPLFAIVALSMAIPTLIGARLYIGISEVLFKKIVLILLSISGIAFLFSALINLV